MTEKPDQTARRAWLSAENAAAVLIVGLVIVLAVIWLTRSDRWQDQPGAATTAAEPQTQPAYLDRVDPNTANWQTLACQPDIGETLAKRIVEYRQSHSAPAFTQPDDLQKISGIGPKTVRKLAPLLVFPDPKQ